MTTPLNDHERLKEAVQRAVTKTNSGRLYHLDYADQLIADLGAEGITLTIEPEPEPLVELPPMTCKQVDMLFTAIQDGERWENRDEGFDAWFELNALVNRARCTPEER